jgi:hypothetical protein
MMKPWFISFGIALAVTIFVFATAFELFLRYSVSPYDANFRHFSLFLESSAPSAAFGDSRTAYGFSGGEEMMNLAEPGESMGLVSEKIRLHYKDIEPRRVILQIDSRLFSLEGETVTTLEITNKRLAYYTYSGPLLLLHPWYASRKFSFLKYVLRGGKISKHSIIGADGFRPEYSSINEWPANKISTQAGIRALNLIPLASDKLLESRAFGAFDEIVSFLKTKGADVCLVSFPIAAALIRRQAAIPLYREFRNFMKRYASQRSLRYSSFETEIFDNALFRDMVHLNARGAKFMSKKILESCFTEMKSEPG